MNNLENLDEFLIELENEIKRLHEHAWKNACGHELTLEIVEELRSKNRFLPKLKSELNDAKISWLIRYIDLTPLEELIPLKISNIGTIHYIEDNKRKQEQITLAIGNTNKGLLDHNSNHGLIHMKYGENKHWNESKLALRVIPNNFINGDVIKLEEPAKYKYYYRFRKNNYLYVIGIPSKNGDATVLVTCLQLKNNNREQSKN